MKLKYIRGFIICKQNMATNGVKNIRLSDDPTVSSISLFCLSILGVRPVA